MTDRVITPQKKEEDLPIEGSLRPRTLAEYIGQEKVKENLEVFIAAARGRSEPLDHVLFHGFPGLGKTSLAAVISNELRVNLRSTSGPVIERPGDLAAILTNLEPGDVLFIDEIHRLNHVVEEILYPAMEDFKLDIIIGQGPSARTIKLDLPPFTLIGATTRAGLLSPPLRDRFGVSLRLEFYSPVRAEKHYSAFGKNTWDHGRPGRRIRNRPALARDPKGGQPASAPGPRLCGGARQWKNFTPGCRCRLEDARRGPQGV